MLYMFIGLTGFLVGSRISHGARKLVRTPHIIYKKKRFVKKSTSKLLGDGQIIKSIMENDTKYEVENDNYLL